MLAVRLPCSGQINRIESGLSSPQTGFLRSVLSPTIKEHSR